MFIFTIFISQSWITYDTKGVVTCGESQSSRNCGTYGGNTPSKITSCIWVSEIFFCIFVFGFIQTFLFYHMPPPP